MIEELKNEYAKIKIKKDRLIDKNVLNKSEIKELKKLINIHVHLMEVIKYYSTDEEFELWLNGM